MFPNSLRGKHEPELWRQVVLSAAPRPVAALSTAPMPAADWTHSRRPVRPFYARVCHGDCAPRGKNKIPKRELEVNAPERRREREEEEVNVEIKPLFLWTGRSIMGTRNPFYICTNLCKLCFAFIRLFSYARQAFRFNASMRASIFRHVSPMGGQISGGVDGWTCRRTDNIMCFS